MTDTRRAIALILTLAAAGCGRGNWFTANKNDVPNVATPPPAAAKAADPAESFGMTYAVNFSGPMPLSGSFSERVSSRRFTGCMDYLARKNEGTLDIEGKTGGHEVRFAVDVPITSAGTYTPEPDSIVNLVFDNDNSRYQFSGPAKTAPVKVVVNGDASGSVTLSNWKNDSGESESGTVSWVCTK